MGGKHTGTVTSRYTATASKTLINPRRACAARVIVLGLCVCYSTFHFSRVYSCHKRYSPSRRRMKVEKFKRFSLKMLRCEARVFPVCTAYRYMISRPFFYSAENAHAYMILDHVASGRFVLESWERRSLRFRLLAIGSKYASNKGVPAV